MELATIARPYAEALFKIAQKEDLTQWSAIVTRMAEVGANSDVKELANNPKLSNEQIVDIFLSLLQVPISDEIKNFITVLVENDRIPLLDEIGTQFHKLKNASEGIADAKIISAFSLSEAQLEDLIKILEKRFGRKLNPNVTVDESLIGGIYVSVGDEVLDLSVREKLQKMQETLVS